MDDPWAAPSWSTPAKPSSSSPPKRTGMTPPPEQPGSFDVSDPWGAPAAVTAATALSRPSFAQGSPERSEAPPETPGWGQESGWGGAKASVPRPPESPSPLPNASALGQADDMPSWGGTVLDMPTSPPPRLSFEAAPSHSSPHHTPPKPFSALPSFSSPRSPLSYHSPARSMTPIISNIIADEEDPEAAFAAALPRNTSVSDLPKFEMPKSPSFGEGDFGGFSSGLGDPWGGKVETGWGGDAHAELRAEERVDGEEEESGEGWGYARPASVEVQEPRAMEQDWEAAQRKIQMQESLVPHDKLERLKTGWKEVADAVIGLHKLPMPSEEEIESISTAMRKLESDRDDTLRSLGSIPSDINTYPPILSSMTTHTTYLTSLSRPNPAPSTSLLINSTKRPRRTETQDEQAQNTAWLSRSRLGEPEAVAVEAAPAEQEGKSRWAFWGRRPQPERQLTTSGGGVLEKAAPGSAGMSAGLSAGPSSADLRKSASEQSAGMTPARSSFGQSPSGSRRTSLFEAPVDVTGPNPVSVVTSPLSSTTAFPTATAHHAPPVAAPALAPAPAPSAVSRFFGRLRRNPSSGPLPESEDNAKDLELGEDDFSFLNQVPSLAPPDLLDQHVPRTHEMANLENMIASRPTPLPAPLAPPPAFSAPVYSRQNSGGGAGRGVQKKRNDMDLLSGLYDDDGDSGGQAEGAIAAGGSSRDPIGWDDFLGPTPAPPKSSSTFRTPTPQPNPASFLSPSPAPAAPTRPTIPQHTSSSSDFDDFGDPQNATPSFTSSGTFDDFGDFSAFESTPPAPIPTAPAPSTVAVPSQRIPFLFTPAQPSSHLSPAPFPRLSSLSTPSIQTHKPRQSLDHTPTLNLVNDASATRGKRWPAPPSPDVPNLPPPPPSGQGGSNMSFGAGFPFLSPPPPPRPGSRSGRVDILGGEETLDSPVSGSSVQGQGGAQGLMSPANVTRAPQGFMGMDMAMGMGMSGMASTPPRSSTPSGLGSAQPGTGGPAGISAPGGKGGLSAQDLSFFDNL